MEQGIAAKIRRALEILINQRIDWNAERCLKREIKFNNFSIPNARGEQNLTADAIKIAPSHEDADGRLRGELMALLRYYEVYKEKTDYEEVDEDLARIGNLFDRLLGPVLELVRSSTKRQCRAAIIALATNSRLLGLIERGRTLGAVSSFLFSEVNAIEELPSGVHQPFREWRSLQIMALQIRPQLRQLLLETCGCFQGTGRTANGVDIVRLVENYSNEAFKIDLADLGSLPVELKQSLQSMSDVKINARVNQILQEAKKITNTIQEQLGKDFDKNEVVDVLRALADKLRMGAWGNDDIGFSANEFMKSCDAFRSSAVKECLALLQKVEEPDGEKEIQINRVSRVAQLSFSPLISAELFLEQAGKVIKSANKYAQALEVQFQGINPVAKAQEIEMAFNDLMADLTTLQKGEG